MATWDDRGWTSKIMHCDEAQELITAHVDHELDDAGRAVLNAHLRICTECAHAFEQEGILKRRIQSVARQISAPAGLRRALEEEKPPPRTGAAKSRWRRWLADLAVPSWRSAFAAVLLVAIGASVFYVQRSGENENSVALAALDTHTSIITGKTALLRAVDLPAMRTELAHAVGNRFKPVVLDLSISKLHPVAGFVRRFEGRDLLVTVYQGEAPEITCFTFLGSDADAPRDAERFFDAEAGIHYYSFTRGDLNGVLHREGEVICLLVSKMAPAELLALLRGKSAHA